MIKRIFLKIAYVLLACQSQIYGSFALTYLPFETIALKLPSQECANWKEIWRHVTESTGCIELIPQNQSSGNWSEKIYINYRDRSSFDKKMGNLVENVIDAHREKLSNCPGMKIECKIIEKNKCDMIFEVARNQQYKQWPPEIEIVRVFFTDYGMHKIGVRINDYNVNNGKREKFIKLLKECVSVLPFDEAIKNPEVLSLADGEKLKSYLNLGQEFNNWEILNEESDSNGDTVIDRIPRSQSKIAITEGLKILTRLNTYYYSIEEKFEDEKEGIERCYSKNTFIRILRKSTNDITFTFSYPKGHEKVTEIVRAVAKDRGYYRMCYLTSNPDLKEEVLINWARKLESIQIECPIQTALITENNLQVQNAEQRLLKFEREKDRKIQIPEDTAKRRGATALERMR